MLGWLVICTGCLDLVDDVRPWSERRAACQLATTCRCDEDCAYPCATTDARGRRTPVRAAAG